MGRPLNLIFLVWTDNRPDFETYIMNIVTNTYHSFFQVNLQQMKMKIELFTRNLEN